MVECAAPAGARPGAVKAPNHPACSESRKNVKNEVESATVGLQRSMLPASALLGGVLLLGLLGEVSAAAATTPEGAAAASADAGGLAAAAIAAVTSSGWAGPAVFVGLYVAATVLLFPASVLTLAAGALYGGCRLFVFEVVALIAVAQISHLNVTQESP